MNMPLVLLNRRRRGFTAFSPSTLFALAEPGVWYDPSDLTTLYQDPAGTTPVTTPGQTVGLMLDKSKGLVLGAELVGTLTAYANATFSTTGGVTTVTCSANGSYGITLGFSGVAGTTYAMTFEVLSNSASRVLFGWTSISSSIVLNAGTTTGVKSGSVLASANGSGVIAILGATAGETFSIRNISVRELPGNHATQATLASRPIYGIEPVGGRRNLLLNTDTLATQSLTVTAVAHTLAFTGTGTVTLSGASIAGPLIGTGASNRVSLTFTPTAASLTLTVVGSVTLGQLELGSSATAYQKVVTAYDVTEAGVASTSYLAFDGVDDGMVTSTITPGVDKVQVFAGVRKLSDATTNNLANFGQIFAGQNGSFYIDASEGANRLRIVARGTVQATATTTNAAYTAPVTGVYTTQIDIAGDTTSGRWNGASALSSAGDLGTGNFTAQALYIGRYNGTSSPAKMNLFSLITRFGANLDAGVITNTETWVAGKTGIVI